MPKKWNRVKGQYKSTCLQEKIQGNTFNVATQKIRKFQEKTEITLLVLDRVVRLKFLNRQPSAL